MKKFKFLKIFGLALVLCVVAANINISTSTTEEAQRLLTNDTSVARANDADPCNLASEYDLTKYGINVLEGYASFPIEAGVWGGFFAMVNGKKVTLGAEAGANDWYNMPKCEARVCNVCAKTWLLKKPWLS
jgi:hypothetical protein